MLLILPLILIGSWRVKLRSWGALMGASFIASQIPALPATGQAPVSIIAAYMSIDFGAAMVVLSKPVGCAQRAIGVLFACMFLFHIGFLASAGNAASYVMALSLFGWAQWACLVAWGLHDLGEIVARHRWLGSASRSDRAAI